MEAAVLIRPVTAEAIVDSIQPPDYMRDRQPDYAEAGREATVDAVDELLGMEGIATAESIGSVQGKFTEIVEGLSDEVVVMTGRCAEPVGPEAGAAEKAGQRIQALKICAAGLGKVLVLVRNCKAKPRSAPKQLLKSGVELEPHMGDEINGAEATKEARRPDPRRMVAAAREDLAIRDNLLSMGEDIPVAKEALLIPAVKAMIRLDPTTGKSHYAGAEVPWLGERTRQVDGELLEILSGVENPVGVKLSHKTTPEEILAYKEKLDPSSEEHPDGRAGKLIFMLRFGLEHIDKLDDTLAAIKEHAPNAMILYDIHGSTVPGPGGEKIRNVGSIIEEIYTTADKCMEAGLKLHGVHLESIMGTDAKTGDERLECVDYDTQIPTHEGGVDPQLNERQLLYLLGAVKKAFRLTA